jgi:hypothetical protein
MHYLFLAYEDDMGQRAMTASERTTFEEVCRENVAALHGSGHLLAAAQLQGQNTNETVRIQDGDVITAECMLDIANAYLASLFLIEARDLNEAIRVASQIPQAHIGTIEVRPMLSLVRP